MAMNVFISWSGDLSRQVALALREWLPNVLQSVKPWVSDEDIPKGSHWWQELHGALKQTNFGIICVTPENVTSPWVLYEAGSMFGRGLRVAPFLTNVTKSDVTGPLPLLQITEPTEADVLKLIRSINAESGEFRLEDQKLGTTFEKWWSDLEGAIATAIRVAAAPQSIRKRKADEMIEEILELTRSLSSSVADQGTRVERYRAELEEREHVIAELRVRERELQHRELVVREKLDVAMHAMKEAEYLRHQLEEVKRREATLRQDESDGQRSKAKRGAE